MKNKVIFGSFIVAVVIGLMLGFNTLNSGKHNVTKYKIATVDKGDIQDVVATTGILNPVTLVDVGSQVSGAIEKIYVDFNSEIRQGEVIAEIDQSSFLIKVHQNEANYKSALASLKKAQVKLENSKKKLERSLELFDKNLISYEEKENTETSYYGSVADFQSAERQHGDHGIGVARQRRIAVPAEIGVW